MIGRVILLHAGQHFDTEAAAAFAAGRFDARARAVPRDPGAHPKGVIFATAVLLAATPTPWADIDPWAFGPWCWWFGSPLMVLRDPIPCRGALGLWRPPIAVLERVRDTLRDPACVIESAPPRA
jgi:hypothetical protein